MNKLTKQENDILLTKLLQRSVFNKLLNIPNHISSNELREMIIQIKTNTIITESKDIKFKNFIFDADNELITFNKDIQHIVGGPSLDVNVKNNPPIKLTDDWTSAQYKEFTDLLHKLDEEITKEIKKSNDQLGIVIRGLGIKTIFKINK